MVFNWFHGVIETGVLKVPMPGPLDGRGNVGCMLCAFSLLHNTGSKTFSPQQNSNYHPKISSGQELHFESLPTLKNLIVSILHLLQYCMTLDFPYQIASD